MHNYEVAEYTFFLNMYFIVYYFIVIKAEWSGMNSDVRCQNAYG